MLEHAETKSSAAARSPIAFRNQNLLKLTSNRMIREMC